MMDQVLDGAIMMASWAAGLFFLRFWKETHDRFFLIFALAFWVLAVNRIALACVDETDEARTLLYVVRLLAFCLILLAIIDKNRSRR